MVRIDENGASARIVCYCFHALTYCKSRLLMRLRLNFALTMQVSMFKKYCNDSGIAGDSAEVLDKLVVDFIVKDLNVTVSSTSDKDNSSSSS